MNYRRYIQGHRKGKDANRIEREAMNDPFLSDALEGYEQAEGLDVRRISDIKKEIKVKTRGRHLRIRNWSVAASLLVCIGLGTYFLFHIDKIPQKEQIAQSVSEAAKETVIIHQDSVTDETLALAGKKEEQEQVKSQPVPSVPVIAQTESLDITVYDDMEAEVLQMDALQDITPKETEKEKDLLAKQKAFTIPETATISVARKTNLPVKGKVVDQRGEPVIGANITVKGTTIGTVTDLDGVFALNTSDKEKLDIQMIGYESITLPADTSQLMLIAMHEDKQALDEMIVFGSSVKTQSPQPVIGNKEYKKYLKEHLVRPNDDECKDIKGKVTICFFINNEGKPCNFTIKKTLCPSADKEAIRLIEEGPLWTVGNKEVSITIKF